MSKNTLRHMYDEWLQFTQLRDECVANMQDQLKQLKPAKTPSFVAFCEANLDVTKHVFECETCGFHAKNSRALSAHRKGKTCVQLRTNRTFEGGKHLYIPVGELCFISIFWGFELFLELLLNHPLYRKTLLKYVSIKHLVPT